jgi:hypothetical protein
MCVILADRFPYNRERAMADIADRSFDYYEPGYRYGYQEPKRLAGRTWDDVRSDLERAWNEFQYRGEARWDDVKDAVRDAWDRATGKR